MSGNQPEAERDATSKQSNRDRGTQHSGEIADLPDPIPDPLIELLAGRLRVIGEPTRIRMLDCLRHGPASVQQLVDAAGTSPQNVSKHLTRLSEHGFVIRERHGSEHRYRIIDTSPLRVLDLLSADLANQLWWLADMIGHSLSPDGT